MGVDIKHHGLGESGNQFAVLLFLAATDPMPPLIPVRDVSADEYADERPDRRPDRHPCCRQIPVLRRSCHSVAISQRNPKMQECKRPLRASVEPPGRPHPPIPNLLPNLEPHMGVKITLNVRYERFVCVILGAEEAR